MKKYLLFIFILISLSFTTASYATAVYSYPLSAANQPAFNKVQQQLAQAENLSGRFVQIREIKLLSSPLKSAGNFVLSKTTGLTWNQTKPFTSKLQLTASKLIEQIGNHPPTVLTKEQQPIVFFFTKTFLSAFQGDTKELKPYFTIYFSGDPNSWVIGLKAKTAPLNKAIKSIELIGGKHINTAIIHEATGDQLTIHFSDVKRLTR